MEANYTDIINRYFPGCRLLSVEPYGNGHINDTFQVCVESQPDCFILQRINTKVFPNPQNIIFNHLTLQSNNTLTEDWLSIPKLLPTTDGNYLQYTGNEGFWRLTSFITGSYSMESATEEWVAFEAGRAFGWFARNCMAFDLKAFHTIIPRFHRLDYRLSLLHSAIRDDIAGRVSNVRKWISFYQQTAKSLLIFDRMLDNGMLPLRVVHNDTKLNNLLFREKRAVAVIDLDTVGPGLLHYDYGDAIRTLVNTCNEDEPDNDLVDFNLWAFEQFSKGYLGETAHILTQAERDMLFLAPQLMTCIMGVRFMTDYLNGDIYYKTKHPEHNLHRSLVQLRLLQKMHILQDEMKAFLTRELSQTDLY